jgi:NADH-quinone oxidoreductase subunit N
MTTFTMPQFSLATPEIILMVMIGLILVFDVCVKQPYRFLTYTGAQLSLLAAFWVTSMQYRVFSGSIVTFSGNYILDKLAVLTKLFVLAISMFTFVYARDYIHERQIDRSDYYILGLLAVLGMLVMSSGYTLLTIYLGLELLSMPLYAMVAMEKHSRLAVEAAMKYFVMGAMASGLLLYGISLIYGVTGTVEISAIATALSHQAEAHNSIAIVGLVFILAGLIFKLGAVPFHMWVPDVYQGAPTSVTLFIASAPKIAALTITFRILAEAMPNLTVQWNQIIMVVAILSMFSGNLLAIAQTNIKRMLAYSSIAHMGYALLGMVAGPRDPQGYSAAMFYIATYVLVAAGGFAIVAILSKKGTEFEELSDYQGLNARNPWLAFLMLLLMFSMAGVPPTVGFFAKLGLLAALVNAHYVWLAAVALLFAIVGAYYYLRVVKLMYFEEPKDEFRGSRIHIRFGLSAAITVNSAAALVLGLFPSGFIDMCRVSLS